MRRRHQDVQASPHVRLKRPVDPTGSRLAPEPDAAGQAPGRERPPRLRVDAGARLDLARGPRRRIRLARRPLRLRQEHALQRHLGSDPADRGAHPARRPRRDGQHGPRRLHAAERSAAAVAHRNRKHRPRRVAHRPRHEARPGGGRRPRGALRSRRVRRPLSARALRRDASARRADADARRPQGRDAARRAVRRARLSDPAAHAAMAARRLGAGGAHGRLHHPRRRRGHLPLGPRARDVGAARTHPRRVRRAARASPRLRAAHLRGVHRTEAENPRAALL